jgi:[FeFe] hydrogenase H-cluster maturation GTPase HydF
MGGKTMDLSETPAGERTHIAFFGRRNVGKSSLLNKITGQQMAVVSEKKGTTTDPVRKSMELLPIGPVLMIDTPGYDDEGELGSLRVQKTREILDETDIAILVTEGNKPLGQTEKELITLFSERQIPYLIVRNKADLSEEMSDFSEADSEPAKIRSAKTAKQDMLVSARTGYHIQELKEAIGNMKRDQKAEMPLVGDLIRPGDFVLLVIPIDKAAPKGRLILPQQQVIRDLLDHQAYPILTGVEGIPEVLQNMKADPALVITDSQKFHEVDQLLPERIRLTSFSILFARYKGVLEQAVRGAAKLARLKKGDRVLISEGCTHHRQCGDIGTVKLPKLLEKYTGNKIAFDTTSGKGFERDPEVLKQYQVILHCGGCMLNEKEMQSRLQIAEKAGVPMTNYGIAIACMNGILKRSLEVFPKVGELLK